MKTVLFLLVVLLALAYQTQGRIVPQDSENLSLDEMEEIMTSDRKKRNAGIYNDETLTLDQIEEMVNKDERKKRETRNRGSGLRNADSVEHDASSSKYNDGTLALDQIEEMVNKDEQWKRETRNRGSGLRNADSVEHDASSNMYNDGTLTLNQIEEMVNKDERKKREMIRLGGSGLRKSDDAFKQFRDVELETHKPAHTGSGLRNAGEEEDKQKGNFDELADQLDEIKKELLQVKDSVRAMNNDEIIVMESEDPKEDKMGKLEDDIRNVKDVLVKDLKNW